MQAGEGSRRQQEGQEMQGGANTCSFCFHPLTPPSLQESEHGPESVWESAGSQEAQLGPQMPSPPDSLLHDSSLARKFLAQDCKKGRRQQGLEAGDSLLPLDCMGCHTTIPAPVQSCWNQQKNPKQKTKQNKNHWLKTQNEQRKYLK